MRTKQEILNEIRNIKTDELLVRVALMQIELEGKIKALKWVVREAQEGPTDNQDGIY